MSKKLNDDIPEEYDALDNEAYREAMDDIANGRVFSASSAEEIWAEGKDAQNPDVFNASRVS